MPTGLAVLCYHRIGSSEHDPWGLSVRSSHFHEQLSVLSETGRIVSLLDELSRSRRSRLGGRHRRFVLTFDDGYADGFDATLKVLEAFDAPATLFVSTGYLDKPHFWWDRVAHLVLNPSIAIDTLVRACELHALLPAQHSPDPDSWSRDELHTAVYGTLDVMRRPQIEDVLDRLVETLGINHDDTGNRPFTTDELREVATHPLLTVGAHTVDHPKLTRLGENEAFEQMIAGRDALDRLLGSCSRAFAYPHGDATSATARLAARAGFACSVTTEQRWVSPLDQVHLVPRLQPPDVGAPGFRTWLSAD